MKPKERRVFKKGKEVLFVSHASKEFKLLILTLGFNSYESLMEFTRVVLGRRVRAENCGHGLKGEKDKQENACSILLETRRQGKITYLFIEAREKTEVLKMGVCKCELF